MVWLTFAKKRPITPGKGNFRTGGMKKPLKGLILHIQSGTENGTFGWFCKSKAERQAIFDDDWEKNQENYLKKNPKAKRLIAYESSAHFGNPKNSQLEQFIDTEDQAYAQGPGNADWLSVENEGMDREILTTNQIHNLAKLMAYLNLAEGVPLEEANNPSESGLGFHSMHASWGHPMCPGSAIIGQRPHILEIAKGIVRGKGEPEDGIPSWVLGWWSVYDTNQYYYYFYEGGSVVYVKQKPKSSFPPITNSQTGYGTATVTEHGLDIRWRPDKEDNTPTIEKFTRMGWSSTTEMFGSSNKYGGLSAKKMP